MLRAPTLMARELKSYFQSPLAYVLTAVYWILLNFWGTSPRALSASPKAVVVGLALSTGIIMLFVVPMITMRLLAGEKDSGTMETLVTDPVTDWDIVLGKYFAGLLCVLGMMLPLAAYGLVFAWLARVQTADSPAPDWGPVLSTFIGLVCMAALYTAVGLFASAISRSQVISAVIGAIFLLALWILGALRYTVEAYPKLAEAVDMMSVSSQLETLTAGQLDTRALFYFLSLTALFLYLSVRVVESRKWR